MCMLRACEISEGCLIGSFCAPARSEAVQELQEILDLLPAGGGGEEEDGEEEEEEAQTSEPAAKKPKTRSLTMTWSDVGFDKLGDDGLPKLPPSTQAQVPAAACPAPCPTPMFG
jgi:hypothetical protein